MNRDDWDMFSGVVRELKNDSAEMASNAEALKKMGDVDRGRFCEGVAFGIKNTVARFEWAMRLKHEPDAMPRPDLGPLVPKPDQICHECKSALPIGSRSQYCEKCRPVKA